MKHYGNVAFKVTWVYGSHGPFSSACTAEGRQINVNKKTWCSQPENRCCEVVRKGNVGGPVKFDDSNYPCNDVMAFRWWSFSSGWFHHGRRKGHPIPMLRAQPGRLAFLTSRPVEVPESDRMVIGCYRIAAVEEDEAGGLWAESDPKAERLRVTDLQKAPRFWDFYKQDGEPRWDTGLFRYLPDSMAEQMLKAVRRASK